MKVRKRLRRWKRRAKRAEVRLSRPLNLTIQVGDKVLWNDLVLPDDVAWNDYGPRLTILFDPAMVDVMTEGAVSVDRPAVSGWAPVNPIRPYPGLIRPELAGFYTGPDGVERPVVL